MINHPLLFFNQNFIPRTSFQKHLVMFLDSKLNFSKHLKTIFQKTNIAIGPLQDFDCIHPWFKFFIKKAFRVSRREIPNFFFPAGPFFLLCF